MGHGRLWLAVISALLTTQHNTSEAAVAVLDASGQSVRVQASAAQEEVVVNLFNSSSYAQVLETANEIWPRLDAMPDRVLHSVAESYIRVGRVQLAKAGFELLVKRSPQNYSFHAGLAYTLLYAGEIEKGLAMYHQVLVQDQGMLTAAAEDAIALLSLGNSGGKTLFQMVIANSPDKQKYHQWYERSLRMYAMVDDNSAIADGVEQPAFTQPRVEFERDRKLMHEQAVGLARSGQYQQSLAIFDQLIEEDNQDKTVIYDYMVILQWAGQNSETVSLYEQQPSVEMPIYVVKSISAAYFHLGQYEKAIEVLQPLLIANDRGALISVAEIHLQRGDVLAAQLYYERLLTENPNDFEVYLSRAKLSLKIEDYRQAAWDLERARRLVPEGADKTARLGKIEHDLAVAYIHFGQDKKAAGILENYTKVMPVAGPIAGDYIVALSNGAQHKMAVQEAERLWPNYEQAPLFGLRALAESYIRLGKQEQAVAVYRYIAERQPSDDASWRTLAFQLLLSGRTAEGLSHYERLLTKAVPNADRTVADAVTLLNTEKYIAGKLLFELVLSKYPQQTYRKQYAEVLVRKNFNRAAYQQYQILAVEPGGELAGLTGMVRTALTIGDYHNSQQALERITIKYGRSKAVAALESRYEDRQRGSMETSYSVSQSYQGTEARSLSMTAEQNIADNYWVLSTRSRTWLDDFAAGTHAVVTSAMAGLRYNSDRLGLETWYGNGEFSTYRTLARYDLNDRQRISLEYSKTPLMDAEALLPENGGPVMTRNYALTYSQQMNSKESVQLGATRSAYSDDNGAHGYWLNHSYTVFNRYDKNIVRNLYWGRTWYKNQDAVYDSPSLRENAGVNWDYIWHKEKGYWSGRAAMEWSRDYPDGMAFTPHVRLEYTWEFSPNHSLSIGSEYGARSNDALGRGAFQYGYRQSDLLYRITW